MFPPKLKVGDTVRVIAPSGSYLSPWIKEEWKDRAVERLKEWGIAVTFGKHLNEIDDFMSSTVDHRLEDFHDAFADSSVQWIACIRGGHNSNQLLGHIDYELIKKNPKVLSGFSDITALSNAIYAKTGIVGYSSPNFYAFGLSQDQCIDYTLASFRACLFKAAPYRIEPSTHIVNAYKTPGATIPQSPQANPGPRVLHPGSAEGTLLGGNMCTFNLLQGTEFMPDIRGSVLFLEDDAETNLTAFDRNLQSLLHQPGFQTVRALVFGRLENASGISDALLRQIIESKRELTTLPIIINVDFGHTHPMATFPIGGTVRIEARADGTSQIEILKH